jgi:hypothetical protein
MPLHPGVDEVRAGGRAASTASPFHRSNFIRPAGAREVKSNNYARDCLLVYLIALFAPPRRAALAEGRVGLPPPPKFTSLRPRRGGSQIVGKFDRAILLALIDRIVWAINVKPPLLSHRWPGRLTTPFMVQRRLTRTNVPRLGPCLAALRVLASSKGPHRQVPIERQIDEYLRNDPFSLAHALERLRRAIHFEELERREGEDWSVAREYVRSLLRRMAS